MPLASLANPRVRSFLAVPLPDSVRKLISGSFLEPLAAHDFPLRLTDESNLHITLHFLGDQSPRSLEQIASHLAIQECPPFSLSLGPGGVFPLQPPHKTLWAGLVHQPALFTLQHAAGQSLTALLPDYPIEERDYRPHITIARFLRSDETAKIMRHFEELLSKPNWPTWTVDRIALYESKLTASGSRYKILSEFPLT